jgi:hypothetical protein
LVTYGPTYLSFQKIKKRLAINEHPILSIRLEGEKNSQAIEYGQIELLMIDISTINDLIDLIRNSMIRLQPKLRGKLHARYCQASEDEIDHVRRDEPQKVNTSWFELIAGVFGFLLFLMLSGFLGWGTYALILAAWRQCFPFDTLAYILFLMAIFTGALAVGFLLMVYAACLLVAEWVKHKIAEYKQ